jgi:hypothetical protein
MQAGRVPGRVQTPPEAHGQGAPGKLHENRLLRPYRAPVFHRFPDPGRRPGLWYCAPLGLSTCFRKYGYEQCTRLQTTITHFEHCRVLPGFSRHRPLATVFRRWCQTRGACRPEPALAGLLDQRIHPKIRHRIYETEHLAPVRRQALKRQDSYLPPNGSRTHRMGGKPIPHPHRVEAATFVPCSKC